MLQTSLRRSLIKQAILITGALSLVLANVVASFAQSPTRPTLTVITHGFQLTGGQTREVDWLNEMATAVSVRQGGGVPIYEVIVRPALWCGGLCLETILPPSSITPSSKGAIVVVNWSAASGLSPFMFPTAFVADHIADLLIDNPQLLAMPIHLIGHSRGGSVMSWVSYKLARRGVWVDQLTTLDPHPVGTGDEPVSQVWQNVVFSDNYWRKGTGGFDGEPVNGALEVDLRGVIAEPCIDYFDVACSEFPYALHPAHEDVHAYYHFTIDRNVSTIDGRALQPGWFNNDSRRRTASGFFYSRNGGGESERPVDGRKGLHSDLAGDTGGIRWAVPLVTSLSDWPNIALRDIVQTDYQIGQTINVPFFFQSRLSQFQIILSFDDNTVTTDDTSSACAQLNPGNSPQISSPTDGIEPGSQRVEPDGSHIRLGSWLLNTSTAAPASCYLRAEIRSSNGLSRFDYSPTRITMSVAPPPPPLVPPSILGPGTPTAPGPVVVSTTPGFSWTAVAAATGGYGVAVSEFPYGPSHIVYLRDVSNPLNGTSFVIPAGILSAGTRYRWNMTSFANGGAESAISSTLYFETPSQQGTSYVVQTAASPSYGGTTTGDGQAPAGSGFAVFAFPAAGFTFAGWTESGVPVSSSTQYTFTINSSRSLVANFIATGIPPSIASQPQSLVTSVGSTAVFQVYAVGGLPLTYQWRKFGVALPGQTGDTLTLQGVSPTDSGSYTVLVSNSTGTQLSDVATLTVNGGSSLRVVDGIRLLQAPPYVVNGTATVHLTIKNISGATLQLDRVQVDGSFQNYFGEPPVTRNWPAQSFVPALSLPPGGTYTYESTNTGDPFPGVAATGTLTAFVKFGGVPGLQPITDAELGQTAVVGLQTIDPNLNYPIDATVQPVGAGTVIGTRRYSAGTLATLLAVPADCYQFSNWMRSGVPVSNSLVYAFQVNDTPSIAANFEAIPCHGSFAQQGLKLVGTGGNRGEQGYSVALSADAQTAVVGGYGDSNNAGAVWAWARSGGAWAQQGAKLVASDANGNAGQGKSVSVSADGNTVIVGGPQDNGNIGAAWVWTRTVGTWTQQGSKLVGSGAEGLYAETQGYSVALSADGNTALIGGIWDNGGRGAAWVWTRTGGVWTQQGSKLVASNSVGTSWQGYAVSLSADGNTAIIGGAQDNGYTGAAWIWTRSNGVWTQVVKLVGTGAVGGAWQGRSVALSADGNTAIVGGMQDNNSAGAAWVWARSGSVWTQQGVKLVGTGAVGALGAWQGWSVSLSADGNTAVVGGTEDDSVASGAAVGAAWTWKRNGGVWTQQSAKLVGSGAVGPYVYQGQSVSLSADGSTLMVGANADNGFAGAVWVYAASLVPDPVTVTVTATDGAASEVGLDPGSFTFSRTGSTASPLTVMFVTSGSATPGQDFADTGWGSVVIPAGQVSVAKVLTPLTDALVEGPEAVTVTLTAGAYETGVPDSATVTIADAGAPGPDLIEFAVSNPPATASPGAAFSVTDTTRNQGTIDAGASTNRYYLSLDSTKSAGDILLSGSRSVALLAAGASATATISLRVPAATPLATYTLLACADDRAVVAESNETNNCLASQTTVQIGWPDLVESALADPPASVAIGTKLTVTDTVTNQGVAAAVASLARYYLSVNTLKDAGDILLTGSRSVASLPPGASSSGSKAVVIPSSTPAGTYYLLACADDGLKVGESNEANNCRASTTTIQAGWPDLVETVVSNPPPSVLRGGKFAVSDTAANQGSAPAAASTTRYYLSFDTIKDASDMLLSGTRSVASLPPGATSSGTKTVVVPVGMAVGMYYVLACADDALKVSESNEANNCRVSTTVVTVQ